MSKAVSRIRIGGQQHGRPWRSNYISDRRRFDKIDVTMQDETVWLSQADMSKLFQTTKAKC